MDKPTVAFLGGGPFGSPIGQALSKTFGLVARHRANLWVVASFGEILKPEQFNGPTFGTLVVHPSLLPSYRGASPVEQAILSGDTVSGVTIIKMDELVDHGPILAQRELVVSPTDRFLTLIARLAELGAQMVTKLIPAYVAGSVKPVEQDHRKASFTKRLAKEDGLLDLLRPAEYLERQVRAYWPWPGSFIWLEDRQGSKKRLIIHRGHVNGGRFSPDMVQLEGKQVTSWREFLRGWRGTLPERLTQLQD